MVDVGKQSDRMLDELHQLYQRINTTLQLLEDGMRDRPNDPLWLNLR